MILCDIMIHRCHYFSVQHLSYEANYSHCFQGKLSLKWNFGSARLKWHPCLLLCFSDRVPALIGGCHFPFFFSSFFFHDKHIHWVNKGCNLSSRPLQLYIIFLYCRPSFHLCHRLMVVQLAFRGYRVLVSVLSPTLSNSPFFFFWMFFLTKAAFCLSFSARALWLENTIKLVWLDW